MHPIEARLQELRLSLPDAPKPVASYLPAVQSGPWLTISGQLPFLNGQLVAMGKVGATVSAEQASAAARQCVLNALAIAHQAMNHDWNNFVRVVRVGVFVASDDTFTAQPKVANGASDLLVEIFGPMGRHARSAVGTHVLPLNASVEVEMILEVRSV